jgi:ribosomal protein S18 acetylase RimI-like enzyme
MADFESVYVAMERSCPIEERRDKDKAKEVFSDENYTLWLARENGKDVGFITTWRLDGVTFGEHFVIYEEYRNMGYGSKVLALLEAQEGHVVLEVEHPITEMAARRIDFYERAGFCRNDYPYMQPSYREGGKGVPLILMSYPEPLESASKTASELYQKVYKCK